MQRAGSELERLVESEPEWFPLELEAQYRGKRVVAEIDSAGRVLYNGNSYESPSAAAAAARRENGYDGFGEASTNGWKFWHFVDGEGEKWALDALRHL